MKVIATGLGRVGVWDRWEVTLHDGGHHRDPYAESGVEAVFTGPGNRSRATWGFYDGGQRWKVRFMPDQIGLWTYRLTACDTTVAEGKLECVESDLPGVLKPLEANPVWFGLDGKEPLLVRSLHVGDRFFAENWPSESRVLFLDWAQQQRYNMLSIAGFFQNRQEAARGLGWRTPRLWPLDAYEFGKLEDILDQLACRRLYVFPFAGFFGRQANSPNSRGGIARYLRYTLARLAPYWNLLFNVGGPEPLLKGDPFSTVDEIDEWGTTISTLDPYGHALTVHNGTGDDLFREKGYTTFGTLQGPKTTDRMILSRGLLKNHHPAKPLYAQETLWSRNILGHPDYPDEDIRKNAMVIMMSASVLNFGDMDGNSSSGFSGTLDLARRDQRRHDIVHAVWDLFTGLPFHRMTPRPDLVDRGYCLAEPMGTCLVYLDQGGAVTVSHKTAGKAAHWVNVREPGQTQRAENNDGTYQAPTDQDLVAGDRRVRNHRARSPASV